MCFVKRLVHFFSPCSWGQSVCTDWDSGSGFCRSTKGGGLQRMVLLVHFGVYLLYVKHLVLGTLCIRSFEAVWFFSGLQVQVHVKAVILKKTRRSTVNSHPQVFDLKMNIKISRIVVTVTLRYRCCSIKSEADQSYTLKGRGALKIWLKAKVISVLW